MIGRICLWIVRRAIEHDEMAFGKIIGNAYVCSNKVAYGTTLADAQTRIAHNWGYIK